MPIRSPNELDPAASCDLPGALGFDLDDETWVRLMRGLMAPPGSTRLGKYELLEEIGRGGQGVVYKARQPGTGRIVAIKRLSAGAFATPEMRDRFKREVEAAAALEHPGVVTVYGSDIVDRQALLAMQWIDGQPIHQWARPASGELRSLREVLQCFEALCDAVQHAHQRGVIHRDLKPSNILVDREDRPHVLDFGLAKLQTDVVASLTVTGDFLGTLLFAAPEQINGKPGEVDTRTDVYSLGAVLYQCLTGQTLFPPTWGLREMFDAVQTYEPTAPSSINAELDREIDAIVLKALSKDKSRRYASVDALRSDLLRYLSGATVLAHPPSSAYRMRKFVQQHRLSVAGGAVLVIVLLAAAVTSTAFYLRAEKQARRAVREAETQGAISQFVTNTMRRAAPFTNDGNKDITVREALLAAAEEIDNKDLEYPPAVEARLRHEIANTIRELGFYRESLPLEQEAVRLSKIAEAEGEEPCLDCYLGLGSAQKDLGDSPGAIATLEDGIAAMRDTPQYPHGKRPQFMLEIGKVRWRQGDFHAALRMHKEAQRLRLQIAPDDVDFYYSCSIPISSLIDNNAPDFPAEAMARETLAYIGSIAPGGANYSGQLFWIAMLVHERGDLDQAERLIHEANAIREKLRGNDYGQTGFQQSLALILRDRNQLEEAESMLREVVNFRSRVLGDDNRVAIDSRVHLATVLHKKGDHQAALSILEDALATYRQRFGIDNIHTVRVEGPLAPVLAALGRTEEAEQLYRHALAIRREVLGERGETATNIHELGAFLLDQGRLVEAEPILEEALAMRRRVRGEQHRETNDTASLLALFK